VSTHQRDVSVVVGFGQQLAELHVAHQHVGHAAVIADFNIGTLGDMLQDGRPGRNGILLAANGITPVDVYAR